tara:strand:- start:985 stop:1164 length:180 start_codon:yes stop_codon:yes gene_type:complete
VLLYTEEQLGNAYRVYIRHIPEGQLMLNLEEFREMIEEAGLDVFEGLLEEYSPSDYTMH